MENKCHKKWKEMEKMVFRSIYGTEGIKIPQSLIAASLWQEETEAYGNTHSWYFETNLVFIWLFSVLSSDIQTMYIHKVSRRSPVADSKHKVSSRLPVAGCRFSCRLPIQNIKVSSGLPGADCRFSYRLPIQLPIRN